MRVHGIGVSGRLSLVATLGILLASSSQLARAGVLPLELESIGLFKGLDRVDGAIEPGGAPYFFEACVVGTGISKAGPNQVVIPSGASNLALSLDDGEWCGEAELPSQGALDSSYPSAGQTYTFELRRASDNQMLSFTVDFSASPPSAWPLVESPAHGGNVLDDRDLALRWRLEDPQGGEGACPTCDGIAVSINEEPGPDVFFELLPANATSVSVPDTVLAAGTSYRLEVSTLEGSLGAMDTQNATTYRVDTVYEDLNQVGFAGVVRTMDVMVLELFKGTDRIDGVIPVGPAMPHFAEICAAGSGFQGNPLVVSPSLAALTLEPEGEGSTYFCFEEQFATREQLDAAYPSDGESYTFEISQADGASTGIPVVWDDPPPGGSIAYTHPMNGASVSGDADLNVTWTLDTSSGCTGAECGDGIAFFLVDIETDMDVVEDTGLSITATSKTVPAASLTDGQDYELEVETFKGGQDALMDGTSDAFALQHANEDINLLLLSVPEPGPAALQAAALGGVWFLARSRRRRRA